MKKKGWIIAGVAVFLLVIVPGCVGIGSYNRLVQTQENVDQTWAQIENVLQRRYDLIPNLINTVKGYAAHEKELFEEVTRLRSQWGSAGSQAQKVQAAGAMEGALGRLMVVVERYPDLKANQNFLALQDELAGTENRIATERRRYNQAVRSYNVVVRRFPSNIIAGMAGFEKSDAYFASSVGSSDISSWSADSISTRLMESIPRSESRPMLSSSMSTG